MKRVIKKLKYCMLFGITLVCILLFASCPNPLTPEDLHMPVEEGYGRISLNLVGGSQGVSQSTLQGIDGPSRTVLPTMAFTKYEYIFTRTGGSPVELAPDNNGFFILDVGNYTVTVNAYIGNEGSRILVATGTSSQFSIGSGSNTPVDVFLSSVNTGTKGTFTYTITYPADAATDITLQKWPEMNDIILDPVIQGNGKNQTLQLDAGSYLLTFHVSSKDGLFAGISEAVHIYPSHLTTFTRDFTENDILHPITLGLAFTLISNGTSYSVSRGSATAAEVIIPSVYNGLPVTSIATNGFANYTNMTSIAIPDSVTSIGDWAFSGCTGLTSITIPNNVTSIGDGAFSGCTGLTSITIPNNVTSIGDWAFSGCTGLTNVIIGNSVTSIGSRAFLDCTGLTSITIPNSVTSIGYWAFSGCTGLTSITIPNNVMSIGQGAFRGCTSLTSITIPFVGASLNGTINTHFGFIFDTIFSYAQSGSIPASLKTVIITGGNNISYQAFYGCTGLTSITIPDSVTSIGNSAFSGCTGLTNVIIPNSVTSIGDWAFSGCTGLTSITIPNNVTSIGDGAFSGCTGLTSITIPDSVTSIGDRAFSVCTGLTSITIPYSVTSIGGRAFSEWTSSQTIRVQGRSSPPAGWDSNWSWGNAIVLWNQ